MLPKRDPLLPYATPQKIHWTSKINYSNLNCFAQSCAIVFGRPHDLLRDYDIKALLIAYLKKKDLDISAFDYLYPGFYKAWVDYAET